jgi:hypothetical protein
VFISSPETPNPVERKSPMMATTFKVVDRLPGPSHLRGIESFRLREIGELPTGEILENPRISLYGLDFENRRAVFVETPADVNLSQAPFYFVTQREKATRVLTIPFETMIQLAQSVTVDDDRLIFIYSVGRCGSTLASQIFAQIPGVINISEPDALTQLVVARNAKAHNEDDLVALLKATICLLCKTPVETAWAIKGRSFEIELGDWLHRLYPQARNLFLYRHAETWLRSGLRAYGRDVEETGEESRSREKQRRELLGPLVPAIAQYDPKQPLPHAGSLALMWLSAMERYVQYCSMGIEMLAIRYASWRSAPRQTAEAMLDCCRCRPADMTAVYETLNRDAQAGTHLSRETLEQRERVITELELEELHWHLQHHALIHDADFQVPNTLEI